MMKPILRFRQPALALVAICCFAPAAAPAQAPATGTSMVNSAFLKFFGAHTNFSCKAEFHVFDGDQKAFDVTPFGFAVAGDKMRMDVDYSQIKGPDVPPAMLPTLKQLGMDENIIITRPDQKIVLNIYPKAKVYSEKPMSKDEITAAEKTYTVEKNKIGHENFEGHPCDEYKVTLTDDKGVKHVATVWDATDLKNFPVQIQMTEQGSTLVMKFRDVKLSKPDASRFEAPSGLTKYKTDEALMDAAAKGTLPK